MGLVLAAASGTAEEGGGAPLADIATIGGGTSLLALWCFMAVLAYRRGGAPRLRGAVDGIAKLAGVPAWAALPGLGAVVCATVIILGATWDIGLHIDLGRDEGPLGTAAHYPLLLGLFASFLMGVIAVGIAPATRRESSPAAFRVAGVGAVPAGALLLLAGGAFGMAAFPLDDLWHRIFGQDVTLWGPTHTMIIGGTLTVGVAGTLLLMEGARAAGRDPFRAAGGLLRRPLPPLLAGICLYLWAAATHEFNWGVPQFRQVWQPLLLSFGAAQALVLARVLGGRGAALGAIAIWMPVQIFMTLMIGGPLEVTQPAMPLFLAEAVLVEALALRGEPRRPVAFGALAGVAIGTVGFAAEAAWSHLVMPLPWERPVLAEAVPVAVAAAVAGGVLGALGAQALRGDLPRTRQPLALAVAATAVFIALCVNAAIVRDPDGVTATIAVENVRQGAVPHGDGPQRVGDVVVRFSDPSIAQDANWAYALGWQGGGRFMNSLVRGADGAWRTTKPVPLGGTWKTMIRVHKGRAMGSVAIRFPADRAIGFAGYPERPVVTRALMGDTELMQLERRDDAPLWAWTPATVLVLSLNLLIAVLMAVTCVRIGRMSVTPTAAPRPPRRPAPAAAREPALAR